jgi:transposase
VVKTYAPKGRTPVLRAPLSRDHLSVISGITAPGWLHTRVQDRPCRGKDVARFLKHLTTHISVQLLVIWDGNPIHRCQEVKALLASPAGQGVHLEQLPPYAPELNPDEGVWNYLNRVELKNVICQHLGQLSYYWGSQPLLLCSPRVYRLGRFTLPSPARPYFVQNLAVYLLVLIGVGSARLAKSCSQFRPRSLE